MKIRNAQGAAAPSDSHARTPDGERRWVKTLGRPLAVVACVAQVAACASRPDSIEARYVSPTMYQNWSCEQLTEEKRRLTKEVQRVSGLQRENANADAALMTVGLILLWPVLFGLAATKDRKDELGHLKGEYDAVDLSVKTKQCTAPAPGLPSEQPAVQTVAAVTSATVPSTNFDGIFKGRGKTDSWCQTPALTVTLRSDTADGQLSEIASGAATSAVTGTVDAAGAVSLDFKGSTADYFTGKVDGAVRDNVLTIDLRSKTVRACSYHFELQKAPVIQQ